MASETEPPAPKQRILPLVNNSLFQNCQVLISLLIILSYPISVFKGTYLSLKQSNLDAVTAKLQSIDSEMGNSKLSADDMNTLTMSLAYLNNPSGGSVNKNGVNILTQLCCTLPPEKRFPALDLLRLFVLYTPESISELVPDNNLAKFLQQAGGLNAPTSEKIAVTNAMLAYRGLANLFITPAGREIAWNSRNIIAEVLQPDVFGAYGTKPARLSLIHI